MKTGVPLGEYTELAMKLIFDAVLTHDRDVDKYKLQAELVQFCVDLLKAHQTTEIFQRVGSQITPEEQLTIQRFLA
jgi:hypothetical protein